MTTQTRLTLEQELEALERLRTEKQNVLDRVSLLVLDERQHGATVRELASRYEVPPSAIQTWTVRGRSLRDTGARPIRTMTQVKRGTPSAVVPVWAQWVILALILTSFAFDFLDLMLGVEWHRHSDP